MSDQIPYPLEMDYTLLRPVVVGGVEYSVLHLEEPTTRQLAQAHAVGGGVLQIMELIHVNAKIPKVVAEQIRQRDLEAISDFFDHIGKSYPAPLPTESPN